MRLFEVLEQSPEKEKKEAAVFSFGRLNPPTIGHQIMINRIIDIANQYNADHYIFLSKTHKPPKDPLPYDFKIELFKKAFPNANLWQEKDKVIRTPYDALSVLADEYHHLIMVVGSDRVTEFQAMEKYAKTYGADKFTVVSAGERDADAGGAVGMSASKARALALEGKQREFYAALPKTVPKEYKKQAYSMIRTASKG